MLLFGFSFSGRDLPFIFCKGIVLLEIEIVFYSRLLLINIILCFCQFTELRHGSDCSSLLVYCGYFVAGES